MQFHKQRHRAAVAYKVGYVFAQQVVAVVDSFVHAARGYRGALGRHLLAPG